jgi:hypothetical protein
VICQHCGLEAPDDRVMCPNCRRRLRPADEESQAAAATPPAAVAPPEPASAPEPAPTAAYGAPPDASPWATPAAAAPPEPPRPQVVYGREVITKSNRLTVGFRIFLAIPQLIVLYVLNVVLEVMGLIGWFAALFTKRLPEGIHEFIATIIRYQARVYAYVGLLTDAYPPFAFSPGAAPDYPIQFRTSQETFNRASVFFRLILVIPAFILFSLIVFGYAVVLIITWFIVVIAGRMPAALFDASAGAQRYFARANSFFWLISPAYPAGLFDDSKGTEPVEAPETAQPEPPRQTAGAKRLIVTFIVVGALCLGTIIGVVAAVSAKQAKALNDLRKAHNTVTSAVQMPPCPTGDPTAQLTCLRGNAHSDAAAFARFGDTLDGLHFSNAGAEKTQLERTTDSLVRGFDALAAAQTPLQFNQLAASQNVEALLTQWDDDYKALDDHVSNQVD